jgi:hypothetical protein
VHASRAFLRLEIPLWDCRSSDTEICWPHQASRGWGLGFQHSSRYLACWCLTLYTFFWIAILLYVTLWRETPSPQPQAAATCLEEMPEGHRTDDQQFKVKILFFIWQHSSDVGNYSRYRNAESMISLMGLRELGWLRRNWRTKFNGSKCLPFVKGEDLYGLWSLMCT